MTNHYESLAAAGVRGLAPYQPGMPTSELERRYGVRNAIKLASNENPEALPEAVHAAMQSALRDAVRYPDGGAFALRAALSEHLGVDAAQLTLGNGSNDILVLLAETFLTSQVAAVYDRYSFVVYRLAVQAAGAEARVSESLPVDADQPLGHDLGAMRALIDDRTRLVYIANPNNPTGTWLGSGALYDFLKSLPDHVIAVVDEAYYEYATGDDYPETLPWLAEFPNLVIVRTFSKAYGLAALRLGYAVSAPGIAELLNRVRQPFNVNSVAQAGAIAALGQQRWVSECRERNARNRAALAEALGALGFAVLPSRGNFLLTRIGPDADACNEFLLREGVIVRPVANYGLPEYLRITVGTAAEQERLCAALGRYVAGRPGA